MIKATIHKTKRNPCKECMYYIKENNTCQSKKCASNNPYITKIDRMLCKAKQEEFLEKLEDMRYNIVESVSK
jgi:hypothetical protein